MAKEEMTLKELIDVYLKVYGFKPSKSVCASKKTLIKEIDKLEELKKVSNSVLQNKLSNNNRMVMSKRVQIVC